MLINLLGLSNFNIHSFSCELGKLHVDMKMNGTLTKKTNEEYENQQQEGSIVRWNG
jgi:hypothetical protein